LRAQETIEFGGETREMRQKNRRKANELTFERGSGNVFADLGLENADELLVQADLAIAIKKEIHARGWTQVEAAERTGLTQSDISRLGKMKTDGFSQERMQNVLRRLGMDIEIRIRRRADGGDGTLKVVQPVRQGRTRA
jgi:predicted XRE-type DNA-binding protein